MTLNEVAAKLQHFNDWRRGHHDEQPDPRVIGEAIDAAVEMIDRLEAAEKERDDVAQQLVQSEIGKRKISEERDECNSRRLEAADHFAAQTALMKEKCDAMRAELAQLHKEADKFGDGIDWIQRSLQAEAQIEQMERQEPVGVLHVGSYYGEELQDWEFEADQRVCDRLNERHVTNPTSLNLYALPGAQGEEK